jgi:Tol biopolymer transport system component
VLYVRPIGSVSARPLAGTEGAVSAFWSPDSRYIGFAVGFLPNSTLKKVEATGGPPQNVARCGSGTWNPNGVIICRNGQALSRVSASGGALTSITTLDTSLQETGHFDPQFLPDGRHFLYLAWSSKPENRAIYVGTLDSDRRTRLMAAESKAIYAPQGFLLFQRQATLFAQAFDATRLVLRGEPVPLAEGLLSGSNSGNRAFGVSSTETLVYRSGLSAVSQQLAWFDRQGRELERVGPAGPFQAFALSPDEKRVAFRRTEPDAQGSHIWTLEMSTGIASRLTTHPANEQEPVWSPDSQAVVFASNRTGNMSVFQRALGSREDVLVFASPEGSQWPDDWSSDGQFILINDRNVGIRALATSGDRNSIRLLLSDAAVVDEARFSPDGRWVAYASTESGLAEIYVASFKGGEFKDGKQVSLGGGNEPQWRRDGRELFYMTGVGQVMSVGVSITGSSLETTAPRKLFATRASAATFGENTYAVSADGERFLVLAPVQDSRPAPIMVVLNWTSLLK